MSFFPCADPAKLRAAMQQNQQQHDCAAPYHSHAQPSQRSHHSNHDSRSLNDGWSSTGPSAPESMYAPNVESGSWLARDPRGLGVHSYNSQGMFLGGATMAPSMDMPTAWMGSYDQASSTLPQPHASTTTKDVGFYNYDTQSNSSLPTSAAWDSLPSATSTSSFNMQAGEMSPGRSDYSTPSQASVIESSPYAHSDLMFQTSTSPLIKTEGTLDVVRPRMYSLPGFLSLDQSVVVNPGDVYHSPSISMSEQQSLMAMHHMPIKGGEASHVPSSAHSLGHHHSMRRAHSLQDVHCADDCDSDSVSERQKRGYTTQANSTCSCGKCGKLFQRSYNLKAHMETHDPHRDQPHACHHSGCLRRFVRRTDLQRHEQSVHLKARNYLCDYCRGSFARKDTLRRHMDDGCPKRPEVRKRNTKMRRASSTASKTSTSTYVESASDYMDHHHRSPRHQQHLARQLA